MSTSTAVVGELLREWRTRRRLSQLELAIQSGVSTRHLSYVETGRSRPSREMVLFLAEHLDVPLRERNRLLVAAGFAPAYRQSSLDDDALASARAAIDVILANHEPLPALVVDSTWRLLDANSGMAPFLSRIAPNLLEPEPNVVRASLHDDGLAGAIVNFDEYAGHLVARLRRQRDAAGSAELAALLDEVTAYPAVAAALDRLGPLPPPGAVLPLHVRFDDGTELRFFSTMTVLGAPLDITLDELAIESFFPADAATAAAFGTQSPPGR